MDQRVEMSVGTGVMDQCDRARSEWREQICPHNPRTHAPPLPIPPYRYAYSCTTHPLILSYPSTYSGNSFTIFHLCCTVSSLCTFPFTTSRLTSKFFPCIGSTKPALNVEPVSWPLTLSATAKALFQCGRLWNPLGPSGVLIDIDL